MEPLFLGNSHSPLVQWKGRVKLLLSYQLKLAKALQVLVLLWVETPISGVLYLGFFFAVPSHVDVPINMDLFRKALPM